MVKPVRTLSQVYPRIHTHTYIYIMYMHNAYAPFFDGISFKNFRIIEKRRPAVRHTSEGLINFVLFSLAIINPWKVYRTAVCLFRSYAFFYS